MAARRKSGRIDPLGADPDADTDSPDSGVTALARSALKRLAKSGEEAAQNSLETLPPDIDVTAFAMAIAEGDFEAAHRQAHGLAAQGVSYELISDTLIAGAARLLGRRWEKDTLSFVEVSLGISELLRINADLRRQTRGRFVSDGSLALFATLRGQTHNLGIILAAEAFRQHRWDVELMLDTTIDDIVDEVRETRPQLVGLTAGRYERMADIAALLRVLKAQSPAPTTMLGGHAVADIGILEEIAHVDHVVVNIADALVVAHQLQ